MAHKITIDPDVCMGSGQCTVYAKATFALDSDDIAYVVDPDGDPLDVLEMTAAACPTGAITVTDE